LDVLWALSTRVDPGKDLHVFPQMKMEPLDPSTAGDCNKLGFDARRPAGAAYVLLASDLGKAMTGEIIHIDGGLGVRGLSQAGEPKS
jgi:3-polyprenyl-4-hydroxybenzoate decarboxylase